MDRPLNILWIVTDHQAHGNRPAIAQHFGLQSRLAREGVRFSRAYSVLPICTPARASMLTGLYPHAHGLTENDGRFGGRAGLDSSDWLIHQPLLEAGYRCAWFGKWHLCNTRSALDFGFEGFSLPGYGYPYATSRYQTYLKRIGLIPPVAVIEMPGESGLGVGTRIGLTEADDWFDFEAGTALLDGPVEAHEAFFLAHLVEEWLETAGEDPFFLRIDPWGPHPPYLLAPPYQGVMDQGVRDMAPNLALDLSSRPPHHRRYRDYWRDTLGLEAEGWRRMVARALEHVALVEAALVKVLDAIDRFGLADRTLVIFTADHGDAVGSNGGVANKGGLMVEETMRIPLLMRGPGIESGAACDRLVANLDIAPTILQMCGLEQEVGLHGESLLELTKRPTAERRKGLMAEHYGLHEPALQRAFYRDCWKLVVQEDGFPELYDLKSDPYETRNLSTESDCHALFEGLWTDLLETMSATGDRDRRLSKILNGPPSP